MWLDKIIVVSDTPGSWMWDSMAGQDSGLRHTWIIDVGLTAKNASVSRIPLYK